MYTGDGPQLAIENTNTHLGNGLWDCYLFERNGKTEVKIGNKEYVIDKVITPFMPKSHAEVYLIDKQGNRLRLIEVEKIK